MIMILTLSDILVWGAYSIGIPLVAIFLHSKFGSLTVEYIGIGTAVYYLLRGLTQLPVGMLTDKIKSDRDEIAILVLGCFLIAVPFFFYPSVTEPWQYYILQAINGLGASFNLNNWRKLFARNLEKNHEGLEYGLYETLMSLTTAVFGVVGGYVSSISAESFEIVIYSIGFLISVGGLATVTSYLVKRKSKNI